MDRNLGATQAATRSTDSESYGDLYPLGRGSDGHQLRNSSTTTTLSSTDVPGHEDFFLNTNFPDDWRSPKNDPPAGLVDSSYYMSNFVYNPCPNGYRLPTKVEWEAEVSSWISKNPSGAFASPLKLPMAGYRNKDDGSFNDVGTGGFYWSSTVTSMVSGGWANGLLFWYDSALSNDFKRANGLSLRCIKN